MSPRIYRSSVAFVVVALLSGALAMWLLRPGEAIAQGSRSVTPEGFEFGVTTPMLKYHFPKKGLKATTFKGTWIAENVEGVRPDFEIDSAEAKLGAEPVAFFSLKKPASDWPAGLYRLEVRADNRLVHTERFIIVAQ